MFRCHNKELSNLDSCHSWAAIWGYHLGEVAILDSSHIGIMYYRDSMSCHIR
jgi:hypothetical protein